MAPTFRLYCSPCCNSPVSLVDNTLTKSSGSPALTLLVLFCAHTPDLALISALAPAPALTLVIPSTNDELFKQFMKAYLATQT